MAYLISHASHCRLYAVSIIVISTLIGTVVTNNPPGLRNFGGGVLIWPEDTPIGTIIGNLTAYDDDGPEPLSFKAKNDDTRQLVKLSIPRNEPPSDLYTWVVDIILQAELDRDYEPNERRLSFIIGDSTSDIPAQMSLFIKDVNDVKPQFKTKAFKATINESVVQGSVVFTGVSATDPDNGRGGTIQYYMETNAQTADENYRTTFQIDQYTGVITLMKPLDYETHNFYQFKIKAVDGEGLEGKPADFDVTVLDVQDTPPYFVNLPYSAEVDENVTVGTAIQQVDGLDGDRGIPNNLTYSFVGGDNANFVLDQFSGWITVGSSLDRDAPEVRNRGGVYAFYVKAEEVIPAGQVNTPPTTATTLVTITVRDINDNAPVFSRSSYNTYILENMQNGVPITFIDEVMRVSDADQGTNSHFALYIQKDGAEYTDFSPLPQEVYAESTVLLRVNNSQVLDYEKNHQLVFEVVAVELDTLEGRSSTATVTVNIEDMNDNPPVFANDTYLVTLKEDAAIEKSVAVIDATDADSGVFGTIRYSIRGGNNKFRIGLDTGVIYVSGELDRETTEEYYLTAEAKDGGGLRTPVEVKVVIEDVNDNAPVFRRGEYVASVRESSDPKFLRPLIVEAFDDDKANTNNSQVLYRIHNVPPGLEYNFTINEVTGQITVVGTLDYEKLDPKLNGKVTLEVMAYDLGEPSLWTTISVNITVEDVNDNIPIFKQDVYSVTVPENATQDTVVLNVTAVDLDVGSPNNKFIYRIENGALDKFRINFETGEIFVQTGAKLDREDKNVYTMDVSAIDKGTPPQTGRCMVIVTLTDVNDEIPEFSPASMTRAVTENLDVGSSVVTFEASDADMDSQLQYSVLKSLTKAYDDRNEEVDVVFNNITEYFDVHENNGTVYVASELDRETAERIVIKILARDVKAWGPVVQTATATLTLILEDYNDNPPRFLPTATYSANISESQDVDSEALRVATVDPDKNQLVTYTIEDIHNAFKIDANTGIIRLKQKLDRELKPSLHFTVIATDNGVPSQSSSAMVFIHVLDINDNSPIFQPHPGDVSISEDASIATFVITIAATDPDIGEYGKVFYSLDGVNNDGTFVINENTGEITVQKQLDRESQAAYTLVVVARDNQNEPQDQRSNRTNIVINIDDVNDNAPQFDVVGSKSIPESTPLGTSVYKVVATDDDAGDNGTVVYRLGSDTNATNNKNELMFAIHPATGEITVRADLHNTVGMRYVTVEAADKGSPSLENSTTLFIMVLDVNDDAPKFVVPNPDNPVVVIEEDQPVGTHIITLSARDDDFGRNGEVVYTLVQTESRQDWKKFHVHNLTGDLTNKEVLDRETHETYELLVRATDRGVPRNYSTDLTLTVRVLDVDDQKPQFDRERIPTPYPLSVIEGSDTACAGSVGIADDKDVNVNFTKICYYLVGEEIQGAFELSKAGMLCLKKKLDREAKSSAYVIVQASPNCYETKMVSTFERKIVGAPPGYDDRDLTLLWVNVSVEDVNDNAPKFHRKDMVLGVTRSTQFGRIIYELKSDVSDDDSHLWGVNKFNLSGGIIIEPDALRNELAEMGVDKPFLVFPNGSLKTNTYFKPTMFGSFKLNLAVYDRGGLNDTAQLRISLINDDQRLKVVFRRRLEDVFAVKDFFTERLGNITGYRVVVDKISTHENDQGTPEIEKTDMLIHGEDRVTDEVIPAQELLKSIDFNAELMITILNDYNIERIEPTRSTSPENTTVKELKMALILVAVILGMLLVVVAVTFYMSRRKYQRKLKAATAMAYGSQDSDLYKLEMPGTNIHSYENANPIYLEKIMLDQVDDDGQNSLDENAVDPGQPFDEQEMSMNIFPEDKDFTNSLSSTDLYLKAALNEHETSRNLKNHDISKNFQHTNGKLKITNGHAHKEGDVITTRNVDGLQTTEI